MSDRLVGKPSPRRLAQLLRTATGAPSGDLLVGPGPGLDAAVIALADGRVMAVAEDPIFPAPGLPLEIMGWFTVHIGASDVAVTGIPPRYMTYTLLLPGSAPERDAETLIGSIADAARELKITIAGGHTGWYDAVTVPIVGGVTVWGYAARDAWVSPGGAQPGDLILMTKGPAVEAAALLGVLYREKLTGKMPADALDGACARVDQITVVDDALTAFATGGVHAMHDATEGGVLGGLWEMHASSGLAVQADLDAVDVPNDIRLLSEALEFDAWQAISEGTLLAAVDPAAQDRVVDALAQHGIPSWIIGRFEKGDGPGFVQRDGRTVELPEPGEDPFWALFFAGLT
jgi:hydrogenase maturation factor